MGFSSAGSCAATGVPSHAKSPAASFPKQAGPWDFLKEGIFSRLSSLSSLIKAKAALTLSSGERPNCRANSSARSSRRVSSVRAMARPFSVRKTSPYSSFSIIPFSTSSCSERWMVGRFTPSRWATSFEATASQVSDRASTASRQRISETDMGLLLSSAKRRYKTGMRESSRIPGGFVSGIRRGSYRNRRRRNAFPSFYPSPYRTRSRPRSGEEPERQLPLPCYMLTF